MRITGKSTASVRRRFKYLIIALQWKSKGAIGGMAQRQILSATHLYDKGLPIACLTSMSLAKHMNVTNHPALICVDDTGGYKITSDLYWTFIILKDIFCDKIRRVHYGGGGFFQLLIFFISSYLKKKPSCTFASRTLKMASYNNPEAEKKWTRILNSAKKIDVLNPGHTLKNWETKISISPCSFPARLINTAYVPKPKERIAVFCGALSASKNPLLAAKIVSQAMTKYPALGPIKLVYFGNGDLHRQLLNEMNAINNTLGYNAIYFGQPDDYFSILQKSAVFFSLQEHDNYPSQSLMEAMYMGCRCIATADGDSALMFPNLTDNILINSRNPEDFVDAFSNLVDKTDACMANHEHIAQTHTLEKYSHYLYKFLESE